MLSLLRCVTTSHIYPRIRGRLLRREPDDVWYEPGTGWMITFALADSEQERIALFVVKQPDGGARATLVHAIEVSRQAEAIASQPLYSEGQGDAWHI